MLPICTSHEKAAEHQRSAYLLSSEFHSTFRGLISSSSLNISVPNCPSCNKYPEFYKTPPTFAFCMILKVVMAIFPKKDMFLGHSALYII